MGNFGQAGHDKCDINVMRTGKKVDSDLSLRELKTDLELMPCKPKITQEMGYMFL